MVGERLRTKLISSFAKSATSAFALDAIQFAFPEAKITSLP